MRANTSTGKVSGEGGFPRELLEKSIEERKDWFGSYKVAHPLLVKAHDDLISSIYDPAGATLIYVFGPPGAGKSTLLEAVMKQLIQGYEREIKLCLEAGIEVDWGRIAAALIEAKSPERGNYDWKDDYTRSLQTMHEPHLNLKIDYRQYGMRRDEIGKILIDPRVTVAALRRALEETLKHRRLYAFFRDEAQHLLRMSSGISLRDQMDTIKSLASLTEILHVLVGNYELLKSPDLSGQLSRRSVDVHLPRYHYTSAADMDAFEVILKDFETHLPLEQTPSLTGDINFMYAECLGLVGLLKMWLRRALSKALRDMERKPFGTYLEATVLPRRKRQRIAKELQWGEDALSRLDGDENDIRKILGMMPGPTKLPPNPSEEYASNAAGATPKSGAKASTRGPGNESSSRISAGRRIRQSPKRHPVGGGSNEKDKQDQANRVQ